MQTRAVKTACLALALLFLAACSADARAQYAPLKEQIEALEKQKTLAYQYVDGDGYTSALWRIGGDQYETVTDARGCLLAELLHYGGSWFERVHTEHFLGAAQTKNGPESGWTQRSEYTDPLNTKLMFADRLPPEDAFSRWKAADGEIVFTGSKAYLQVLRDAELAQAALLEKYRPETADAQFKAQIAERTMFRSCTLTVKTQDGYITAACLSIEREEPVWAGGMDGSYTVSEEMRTVTETLTLTLPEADEAEVRRVIEDVAATLDL